MSLWSFLARLGLFGKPPRVRPIGRMQGERLVDRQQPRGTNSTREPAIKRWYEEEPGCFNMAARKNFY